MDAVIYARISKDRAGEGLGVARQVQACTAKATAQGWNVAATYTDNDVSASKNVPRPEYERLMADIESGAVRAVVVYDLDRLTRKPAELESFITLADTHGIALANVSGDVDLTNANGRMIARIKGAVARQEAERIGERNTAQKAQRASMGLPMGTRYRVYGYERDWSVNETEAAIVRDLFARAVKGESKGSLTRWMNEQGNLTTAGSQWNMRATARLLSYAGYADIYVFKGERIGSTQYPALIDEATFEAANADSIKLAPGHNTRKYLLSNILVCDACKAPMIGSTTKQKGFRYRCNPQAGGCGVTSIKGIWLDNMVDRYMSNMVAHRFLEAPTPAQDYTGDLEAVDARIEALHAAEKAGEIDLADLMRLLKDARSNRAELVKAQAAVVETTYQDAISDYDSLDLSVKRSTIKRYVAYIFVKPWTRVKHFDENRLYVLLADGTKVPGSAINTVDARDAEGTGTRAIDRDFDPEIGY